MDGNKFKDCRFRIAAWYGADWGQGYSTYFALERRCTKRKLSGEVEVWENRGSFRTRDEARAHYELIKDLPEYLP